MILKSFIRFINENIEGEGEEFVNIQCSNNFITFLTPLRTEYKVARVLLQLNEGIQKKYLIEKPANYLDMILSGNQIGYISYLKYKNLDETDKWYSRKRIAQKATKALREFYKQDYLESELTNVDFENFFNKVSSITAEAEVIEFRGTDVLRAYNYAKELSLKFSSSCANFYQAEINRSSFPEPKLEWYDVYIKNPKNFGVVVVIENGEIMGRKSFQQGINLVTADRFKKGKFATIHGIYYGVSGKYNNMIDSYLEKKYDSSPMGSGGFAIQMETRFALYPPFDSMYVCFKYNIITESRTIAVNKLDKEYKIDDANFQAAYKATCPKEFIKERLEEEAEGKTYKKLLDIPEVQ
jgi:hypothetical protein